MSPLRLGIVMVNAIAALKLKGAYRTQGSAEGVEIIRPGYPTITITAANAEEYARRFEE